MKSRLFLLGTFVLGLTAFSVAANADEADSQDVNSPWLLRVGVANLQNSNKFNLSVGGQPVPGAALHFHQIYTPMAEIGYHFTEDFAAVATVGFPPAISANGGGTIAPFGKLESTTFGPTAFTVQYQPFHSGVVRPYIGAGFSYMIIFSTHDALVQNAGLSNDLAPALELGSEFALDDHYGLFIEGKKAFLQTHATGTIGGAPLTGTADIAPWVFSVGLSARL